MKRILSSFIGITLCFLMGLPLAAFAQSKALGRSKMTMPMPGAATKSAKPLNVAFLIYPGVEALDLSGPLDVFVKANQVAPETYNLYTVAVQSKPILTQSGALTLTPRYTFANCPRPDILIVPSASEQDVLRLGADPRVIQWVKHNATPHQTVMSVCTGAFLLGDAGLLNGKDATTHWLTLSSLQRHFPQTRAFGGVKLVQDGNIVTTAGVSSGIDGAFLLVEKTSGQEVADSVAKAIQYRRGMPAYPNSVRTRVVLAKPSTSSKSTLKLASNQDPVCGMEVEANPEFTCVYHGQTYGFCSQMCLKKFEAHPEKYVK